MTARFNIYFNGEQNFKKILRDSESKVVDDYTQILPLFPIAEASKKSKNSGFDMTIEKCLKCIQLHSIKVKPKRNTSKDRDEQYQLYYKRNEFNDVVIEAWQMMGQAQFYKGEFEAAAATFNYMGRYFTHDKETSVAAQLWAIRSYLRLKWIYEAEDVIAQLPTKDFPSYLNTDYALTLADFYIVQERYKEAIPQLEKVVEAQISSREKRRYYYILGQMYQHINRPTLAFENYGRVLKYNPSYEMELNARIRQAEVYIGSDKQRVVRKMERQAKREKNKEYLDQIYFAIGNVYLADRDTARAIANYTLAADKSSRNGADKANSLIRLGDLHFDRMRYQKAKPCYSDALPLITEENRDYKRVSKRATILEDLVIYDDNVTLQDSLQRLASMTPEQRDIAIKGLIAAVEKAEQEEAKRKEEELKRAYLEEKAAENPTIGAAPIVQPTLNTGDNSWYFYNRTLVNNGRTEFQRKWGKRKLEDNWRRRKRSSMELMEADVTSDDTNKEGDIASATQDSAATASTIPDSVSTNPKDPNYYLQQIPMTPEAIAESNLIIEESLYQLAIIYKDRLDNIPLALATWAELLRRFPQTEYRLEAYFSQYLIHRQYIDPEQAERWRGQILTEFPESRYATILKHPDYQQQFAKMQIEQDSLYSQSYEQFAKGDIMGVRAAYLYANQHLTLSPLLPRFMLLYALTLARNGQEQEFVVILKDIVNQYPDHAITPLASNLLESLNKGMKLSTEGYIVENDWRDKFELGSDSLSTLPPSKREFRVDRNAPHILLFVFNNEQTSNQQILYDIAQYNFTQFLIKSYDLEVGGFKKTGYIKVEKFNNYNDVMWYRNWLMLSPAFRKDLYHRVVTIILTEDNYDLLRLGKSLESYQEFYQRYYIEDPLGKKSLPVDTTTPTTPEKPAESLSPIVINEQ